MTKLNVYFTLESVWQTDIAGIDSRMNRIRTELPDTAAQQNVDHVVPNQVSMRCRQIIYDRNCRRYFLLLTRNHFLFFQT